MYRSVTPLLGCRPGGLECPLSPRESHKAESLRFGSQSTFVGGNGQWLSCFCTPGIVSTDVSPSTDFIPRQINFGPVIAVFARAANSPPRPRGRDGSPALALSDISRTP